MSEKDEFYKRANKILLQLEKYFPETSQIFDPDTHICCQWQPGKIFSKLVPVDINRAFKLDDLQCINKQKTEIIRNTRQFLNNYPANNVLLWGPRGTGKSSLIKAVLNEYCESGLRLVEVERSSITDLPEIIGLLKKYTQNFIVFCDDLSFESNDSSYKALKVFLDGSISTTPDNVLIYATSNRRHLLPEYMDENIDSKYSNGEVHLNEAIEEKISLSERFGMWISFHPFNQSDYLQIVRYWITKMQAPVNNEEELDRSALNWALEHGSRSGRSAWLFARDWTGKHLLINDDET